ncbi:hypothetical protein D3C75_730400 [compost metagenome]
MEIIGADGHNGDAEQCGEGKGFADLLVAEEEKRQVEEEEKYTEGQAGQVRGNNGNTGDAAVNNGIGHQEYFQCYRNQPRSHHK